MSTTNLALPVVQRVGSIEWSAAGLQNGFFLPWGTFVLGEQILSVQINGGPPLVQGADYTWMIRQHGPHNPGWPQPSTHDVVRGVWMTVAPAESAVVKITYVTRELQLEPPVPLPIYAPGDALPVADTKSSYTLPSSRVPFQLLLPQRKDLQVELWRRSEHAGSARKLNGLQLVRGSRQWFPYWRSPVAMSSTVLIVNPLLEKWFSAGGGCKNYFRMAYFDPNTGARTRLSDMTLMISNRDDRVGPVVVPSDIAHPGGVYTASWVGR